MKKTVFVALSFLIATFTLYSQPYLYGVNFKGNGVITKYDLKTNTLTAEYKLTEADGDGPYSSMIKGDDGLFYGVTSYSGSNNYGTLFSFNPLTQMFAKLHDFNGVDGGQPSGSLVRASNGKLYGLSLVGGTGNIYSFDLATHIFQKHYVFNKKDGEGLYGSLVQAADGKLYGLTFSGGHTDPDVPGFGTLFMFDPNSNSCKTLFTFDGNSGANPYGSLVLGKDNILYGTAHKGGSHGQGTIFSFNPNTAKYTKLYDFDGINGAMPYSNLMQASNGLLYGTTQHGGQGAGTVYSFDPAQLTFVKLHEFQVSDGAEPSGTLMEASDNLLYGTSEQGGKHNMGVLYLLDPKTQTVKTLQDYDGINGSFPHFGALVEVKPGLTAPVAAVSKLTLSTFPNPSASYFNLAIEHNNNHPVELRIFDASGKLVEVKKVNANTVLQIGHAYAPGTYFAEVSQGKEKTTLELVKK